jgi:hypothetical protein
MRLFRETLPSGDQPVEVMSRGKCDQGLPLAQANIQLKGEAFELVRESLKFPEDGKGLENLMRELGR